MDKDFDTPVEARKPETGDITEKGLQEVLWGLFSSMKTAIVLLMLLAAASIMATLLENRGVKNIYHSNWYITLLALMGANLAVCSINRFGMAWRRTFQPKVSAEAKQISNMQRSESLSAQGNVDAVKSKVLEALKARSYHPVEENAGKDTSIYASKGRIAVWGPYMTHLSLLIIFLGGILGGIFGFEGYTSIVEGEFTETYYPRVEEPQQPEKTPLGFRIGLRKFTIEYDKTHSPTAYKSDLQIYEGDKVVASKVIDVNHPLTYKGTSFFQTDYGVSGIKLKVTAPNGETAIVPIQIETGHDRGMKIYQIAGGPVRQVDVGGKKVTFLAHGFEHDFDKEKMRSVHPFMPLNPAIFLMMNDQLPDFEQIKGEGMGGHPGMKAWSQIGWLQESETKDFRGYKVTFDDVVDYTGLQVAGNPALPIIYIGFTLMLVGVFVSFYVAHKVIRVRISPSQSGSAVTVGAMTRADQSVFDADFERLREAVG